MSLVHAPDSPVRTPPGPAVGRPRVGPPRGSLGPSAGLVAQFGLLGVLAGTVGVRTAGWVTGAAFAFGTWAFLQWGLGRAGRISLGPADVVTLSRCVLVGGVVVLAADAFTHPGPARVVTALAAVALTLDGVDGAVARRTGTASALGARFDLEVDAALILALSVLLVRPVGAWVLAIGGMRYAFAAAGLGLPWLTGSLPARFSRKVVAVAQGLILLVGIAGVLPDAVRLTSLLAALTALTWSFGRDVRWLARSRSPLSAR